jgi:T4 superinfection immunity protein
MNDGVGVSLIFLLIFLLIMIALYFLPTFLGRQKRNANAIFALNLLLGWTFVGWVFALVWALAHEDGDPSPQPRDSAV